MTEERHPAASSGGPEAYWTVGVHATIRAGAAQTGGALALVEERCPAGYATPLHVHHAEDEAFYVLEGRVTVFVGETRVVVGPGDFAYGPRGVPHGFRVDATAPARLLLLATPSGFERFLAEMGVPADGPPPTAPLDEPALRAVGARYGIEVLGPLPA